MPDSRRILITGLSSHWGGRLAQQLEANAAIETIVGVDTTDPKHELQRTEFVRVDTDDAVLRRIVKAAAIDTVVDTRLIPDPLLTGIRRAHEVNVLGTRGVLGACGRTDSPVRKLVFKSSAHYYGSDQSGPAFFSEDMVPPRPPQTAIERDVVDAELALAEFAGANPETTVTVLRFAGAVGGELRASHLGLLNLPVVPAILGFDPRCQFIHGDDVLGVLAHAVRHDLPGNYNAAADGVLALSEVVSLLGKPLLPVLPPWGTGFAARQLRRLGLRVPVEMLRDLRFGRGLDNRKLKAAGYSYRYTTRETVQKLRAQQRLRPLLRSGGESYRYERDVEEFLRWSPSVQGLEAGQDGMAGPDHADGPSARPAHSLDSLSEGELLEIIPSLETEALEQLSGHEAGHQARRRVLDALEQQLARRSRAGRN
ncbi:MAG: NAD-dependent epimerase/dehydratase family protein [Actinomycetota bacterium]|nr:NAD-dependent epimerase/dehydratase family protein [Actinomycetota bacterium]